VKRQLCNWTLGDPTTQGPTVIALRSLSARNDPPPPIMVWLFTLSAVWIAARLLRRRSRRGFRFWPWQIGVSHDIL